MVFRMHITQDIICFVVIRDSAFFFLNSPEKDKCLVVSTYYLKVFAIISKVRVSIIRIIGVCKLGLPIVFV